jgi:hypothetical protein
VATQPGKSGQYAEKLPFAFSITIRNRTMLTSRYFWGLSTWACFKMLLNVPGARSSPGCPAIVTRPGFLGCLYCLWLPYVTTRNQPLASIS